MRIRDPKPEIQRLEELVKDIRHGGIRLPKFQRAFVWNKNDMLNLLDSIYNGYPIGSILLWNSSERLKSERAIYDFKMADDESEIYPTDYLLDGQQRLTTLCGALYWEGDDFNSIWNIHFDLENEKFVYPSKEGQINLFPLNKLLRTSDFIRQCMKFEGNVSAKIYYDNAEKLLDSIKNYKVAVVKIGDVNLEEIAPIFERINSTGRKLTMVDLMRAATWKGAFDLTEVIRDISNLSLEMGMGEVSDTLILRGMAAAAGLGINKADIDRLRNVDANHLHQIVGKLKISFEKALIFLKNEIEVPHLSYIPYGAQVTHLVEFFRISPNFNFEQKEKLIYWFWITSITRYFAGANTGQNSKDLERTRLFSSDSSVTIIDNSEILDLSFLFEDFNLRTASSKTMALLLIRKTFENNNYYDGRNIISLQEISREKFMDLVPVKEEFYGSNISQVFNPAGFFGNQRLLRGFTELNGFVDDEILRDLQSNDFRSAIMKRTECVADFISDLTGRKVFFNREIFSK